LDTIRLKIKITPAKTKGLPLSCLSDFPTKLLEFLDNLSQDTGVKISTDRWLADNFENGSVGFETSANVETNAEPFKQGLINILNPNRDNSYKDCKITDKTKKSYYRTLNSFSANDKVDISVYNNESDGSLLISAEMTKSEAEFQLSQLEKNIQLEESSSIQYYGGVRGIIHSWFKEANPPYFQLRELITGNLIKCFYDNEQMYDDIFKLFEKREAIVIVSGQLTAIKEKRELVQIKISKVDVAPQYQEGDLDKFIGCLAGVIGDLTPSEFLERIYEKD